MLNKCVITILRQENLDSKPYWQSFEYHLNTEKDTIITALREINSRNPILDVNGDVAKSISFEQSCLQKKCGACAMVINGVPKLACGANILDYADKNGNINIKVEPLRKFPKIRDLVVDRSILFENLKNMKAWLENDAKILEKRRDLAYKSSECLQCGCCLEVCPNFYVGGKFYSTAAVPIMTRLLSETELKERSNLTKEYIKHEFEGCGKSLACRKICPKNISVDELLVNSNLLTLWKRR